MIFVIPDHGNQVIKPGDKLPVWIVAKIMARL